MGYKKVFLNDDNDAASAEINHFQEVRDLCPADRNFLNNIDSKVKSVLDRQSSPSPALADFNFVGEEYDYSYLANVGWHTINENNAGYKIFFSEENMNMLSSIIFKKLQAHGLYMVVTKRVIAGIMSDLLRKHSAKLADIHSIFTIPDELPRNDLATLNERVVNTIVSTIVNEDDMRRMNESLNIWDTVYGDFNRHGLRAHSKIRKRERDYLKGQFNINY